ncbi:MAG TPA: ArsR family transcriptional regulator [Pyrinomonadaceae bacterium]|nr:ArsR family transcriptional regulator [Pyrinomonadaceae bacterium]
MKRTKLDKRFFGSTRGRLVTLLRGTTKTVNELAEELELTDNAVRAHLLSLERDGLIRQRGIQRGTRKPHFAYELTEEAEHLFPKAYDALLNQLIAVLKGRLTPLALEEVLREVGRSLAAQAAGEKKGGMESRIARALSALEAIGGAARVEKDNDKIVICSESCPVATAVSEHPEVCTLAETLLSEIIGVEVQEHCDREGPPRCRFEVIGSETKRGEGGSNSKGLEREQIL